MLKKVKLPWAISIGLALAITAAILLWAGYAGGATVCGLIYPAPIRCNPEIRTAALAVGAVGVVAAVSGIVLAARTERERAQIWLKTALVVAVVICVAAITFLFNTQ